MNNFDYLLQLPGEEREREWIRTRLETLSAQESIQLTAAALRDPPQNTVDAVNQLNSLFLYWVRNNAGSYEQLGEFYLKEWCNIPETILPHADLTKAGMYYASQHPGRFVENYYVTYPGFEPKPFYQGQGAPLPDSDWVIKLKLASPAVPEGVWMGVPGREGAGNVSFVEENVTKAVLHVEDWNECTLLDARCILPGISGRDLMEQYSDVADLVEDGISLGDMVLCDWSTPPAQYAAALELEGCHSLKMALDIYQNLNCYDWMPYTELEASAKEALIKSGISESLIQSGAIDLKGYGTKMVEEQGYALTADGTGYIVRNANEFSYQFSPSPSCPDVVQDGGICKEGNSTHDFDGLVELTGTDQERNWLRERLETLSVREGIILSAALQRCPPQNAVDAINCLQSLDCYEVRVGVGSYEALGSAYLRNETKMPESAQLFADLDQMGCWYEDKHPGLFVGNCYVEYPENALQPVYQGQGSPLPEDKDWSVRLKIASAAVPEGVWLRLPSPSNWDEEDEITPALQELRVQNLADCTLLDAQCILPRAGDLMEQYDNVADLIYNGQELGYVLGEHGQGSPTFMERYVAALELEHCHSLKLALDIAQNLNCYDWVSCADLEASATGLLLDAGVSEELIRASGIDLIAYKAHLLENQGYTPTAGKSGYIARNSQEFHCQYSTPIQEQSGMMMQ